MTEPSLLPKPGELHQAILDVIPTPVYFATSDYIVVYANAAYHNWINQSGPLLGRHLEDILGKETFGSVKAYIDRALQGNVVSFEFEGFYYHQQRTVAATYTPQASADGKIIGYIAYVKDRTEQKRAENELREANRQLMDYIENANIGLHWVDASGIIKWANQAELDMMGYSEQEYIGHHISEFHADKEAIALILHQLGKREEIKDFRTQVVCKDGSKRTVLINSSAYYHEGAFIHSRCFTVDITEQSALNSALAESENRYKELNAQLEQRFEAKVAELERYHKMIDEVADYAIIFMDRGGIVQNWNKGAERIKGYKEEEIVGKSFTNFYLPEDRERGLPESLIEKAAKEGRVEHEGYRVRKDGSTFWGSIVITALHDSNNNVIGFSKVTRDLTERKIAEDRIRQNASDLAFQNEELKQFAFITSHDMKEPLRKIILYNNQLLSTVMDRLNEKEQEKLQRSADAARRMQLLIDDILSYSQTAFGTQHLERVDLNSIVEQAVAHAQESIQEAGATVTIGPMPVINGVPHQLAQLFDNLLSNAIKYREPARPLHIGISCQKIPAGNSLPKPVQGPCHQISVRDNGLGFAQEDAERIFELFQRLLDRKKYAGTGIGLAICKKIVQNHHGVILATATPGVGACFDIYLPAE